MPSQSPVSSAISAPSVPSQPFAPAGSSVPIQPTPSPVADEVRARLLEIVADQTGYAADMLDLSMAVEADLGGEQRAGPGGTRIYDHRVHRRGGIGHQVLPGAGDLGDGGQRERDHGCTSHGSGSSPGGASPGGAWPS